MKSKYFLTLFLIGFLPIAALAGVYYWMALNEAPAPAPVSRGPQTNTLSTTIPILQTQLASIGSALSAGIKSAYQDVPGLVANHSDADLDTFVKTHQGLAGVAVFSTDGKLLKTMPATAQLADPAYGSSEEFQKMMAKFKENGGKLNLFFTSRLNFPAFIFSIPLDSKTVVQAVLNLAMFFRDIDPKGGEIFLLDADSGQYFYHSNPAKLLTSFNPNNQETWLAKVQAAIVGKQSGSELNPPANAAIYTYLGIKSFGIVHIVPFSVLQPPEPVASPKKAAIQGLPDIFQSPTGMYMGLAALASLGWILFVGVICYGMILSPLRKASALVLKASQGAAELSPQSVKAFGTDEVGQMVQAAASLTQKLEQDKQQANQEKEEALKRGRAELDAKAREAANQVAAAQQQAAAAKTEANDKNQQLNDKLKELDALKGMSEGLRNQTEQAKGEIAKLKTQVSAAEQSRTEIQAKLNQTQTQMETQLKEMESKLLSAVAASSAIQVSSVRAAAIRTMSEELKTTLGIIKGYVSSALGATQGGINEKQQEFLGMVINRSARLEKFINDLVDIYQVEIEQATAQHEEVNLASEIEGLAFNFQAQAEVKNIKMRVEAKGTLPKVPIVRRRFNQLWNILYLQIIKDSPRGSNIPITVEPIGENVKVTIVDPGLMVLPESLPKLFDEFYDPKHPASPQLAGTGLKFALVKTILAAHGGGAVAEKAEPGTRMILTFPTKIKKPGENIPSVPLVGASPSVTAPAVKAPPAAPGAGIGMPKPPPPAFGLPKPPSPAPPPAPGAAAGAPKPAGSGLLDSLISKVPPVSAPGLKPPPAGPGAVQPPALSKPPGPPSLGAPPTPAAGAPPAMPKPPGMPAPGAIPPPAAPKPAATPPASLLDALLDKKPAPPTPGAPPVAPVPGMGVKPPMPAPGAPPMGPKPPIPIPGMPASGVPLMPPKPVAPPVGAPPIPTPGTPAAPNVVPTSVKPTTPPPGILDMDNMDGMKLSVPAPKPPVPGMPPSPSMGAPSGAPKPPMPGSPMPPAGMLKPPGVPPGGLNTNAPVKKDEGELIE